MRTKKRILTEGFSRRNYVSLAMSGSDSLFSHLLWFGCYFFSSLSVFFLFLNFRKDLPLNRAKRIKRSEYVTAYFSYSSSLRAHISYRCSMPESRRNTNTVQHRHAAHSHKVQAKLIVYLTVYI